MSSGPQMSVYADVTEVSAHDEMGNPVCIGCGGNGLFAAVLANSGSTRSCACPPEDRRVDKPEWLAEALLRITNALDHLDRLGHSPACNCDACQAYRALTEKP